MTDDDAADETATTDASTPITRAMTELTAGVSSESSPSVAALFDLLSHRRRRLVVLSVAGAPETGIRLRTLAETMYAIEHDETPATAPTRSVTNLKTNIVRSHLPHLRATGCVTQDGDDRLHPGPQLAWAVAVIAVGMLGVDH